MKDKKTIVSFNILDGINFILLATKIYNYKIFYVWLVCKLIINKH